MLSASEIEGTPLGIEQMPAAVVEDLAHAMGSRTGAAGHIHTARATRPGLPAEHHEVGRRERAAAAVVGVGRLDRVGPFLERVSRGVDCSGRDRAAPRGGCSRGTAPRWLAVKAQMAIAFSASVMPGLRTPARIRRPNASRGDR